MRKIVFWNIGVDKNISIEKAHADIDEVFFERTVPNRNDGTSSMKYCHLLLSHRRTGVVSNHTHCGSVRDRRVSFHQPPTTNGNNNHDHSETNHVIT